jgi:cell shape-determining protein MreD
MPASGSTPPAHLESPRTEKRFLDPMRVAAQVLLAYGLILLFGCLWQYLPLDRAVPDVAALSAIYLGLTARQRLAPATLGAVLIGYLSDLLLGTPRGSQALVAGVLCILGHVIHRRLLLRGRMVTMGLAAFTGLCAGLLGTLVRLYAGHLPDGGDVIGALIRAALVTGLIGPLVFRSCRAVDARFARTHREREAAREGLTL